MLLRQEGLGCQQALQFSDLRLSQLCALLPCCAPERVERHEERRAALSQTVFDKDSLTTLLLRFVRMSDKKEQQEVIDEIKHVLRSLAPAGFE